MLRSWFLLAVRTSRKSPLFTVINIVSLALGFCASLAIILHVQDELSFEHHHSNRQVIYRITTATTYGETENRYSRTCVPLYEYLHGQVSGVEKAGRLTGREATMLVHQTKEKIREREFYFADPEIIEVFTFDLIAGHAKNALVDRNSLLIARSVAEKLFGNVSTALGKTITVENRIDVTVTGVYENWPSNSHVRPELITHFDNYLLLETEGVKEFVAKDWLYSSVLTYIRLSQSANRALIEKQINDIRVKNADERVQKGVYYTLQPLSDIHFYSNFSYENNASITFVWIIAITGILILTIGCFNFINLSIAHSLKRMKEIAMKKTLGLDLISLRLQLLAESMIFVVVSLIIAIVALYFLTPFINEITSKELTIMALWNVWTVAAIFVILLFTVFLAGGYPAFYISSVNIQQALKGANVTTPGKLPLRKILIVAQFCVAFALIFFTVAVNEQLNFMRNKPTGFTKDNMLIVPLFSQSFNSIIGSQMTGEFRQRMNAFEETVLKNHDIKGITASSFLPGQGAVSALTLTDSLTEQSNVFIPMVAVDYDFVDTYDIKLLAGRNFSRDYGTDHLQAFMVNEAALKVLGFGTPAEAIGKFINATGKQGQVVGVISNYQIQGAQFALQPLLLEVAASKFSTFSVKISDGNRQESIEFLKTSWEQMFPESIFEYSFLDERLEQNYQQESRLAQSVTYFSLLAYLIAGIGLFGFAAYVSQHRLKEVGIRKIHGASSQSIFVLLSTDFLKLVFVAFVLAIPISFIAIDRWLQGFHEQSFINPLLILYVMLAAMLLTLAAIAQQTLRVSRKNPINILKVE